MAPRPPAPVRYLVLAGALLCLVCTVCARGPRPTPHAGPVPGESTGGSQAIEPATPDAGPPVQQAQPPPPEPEKFFPATKAPGRLY